VAPLPPQHVFEGWYLGGTIGGATVSYDFAPAGGTADTSGVLGGVVGGYSWQSGPFVLGVEGDLMAAGINGSQHFNSGFNQVSPSIDAMADLRLRAGYAVRLQVLLFANFGGAWANADLPVTGPGGRLWQRGLLRLERRRRRRSRSDAELVRPLRLSVHRLQFRDGELPGRLD
jgi:opacity protein-like surface antigen